MPPVAQLAGIQLRQPCRAALFGFRATGKSRPALLTIDQHHPAGLLPGIAQTLGHTTPDHYGNINLIGHDGFSSY
jgi:hypothetical protein